ncbi:MAG: ATP-dependent RNA helicase HrpA [Gammaproteobacteria bacterium]
MSESVNQHLKTLLEQCLPPTRLQLRKQMRRCKNSNLPALVPAFQAAAAADQEYRDQRRAACPAIELPSDLPISGRSEEIISAIRSHQVLIICGETGSGKTTQIPKLCLAAGRGIAGQIGHTQPRRLAAQTLANRIAAELQTEPGTAVGYKIRHTDQTRPGTFIKLMTDGILLAELRTDRDLLGYDTLIIDEAHERSLNIDFMLGYLKQLLPRRPDLKVIITSATIDVDRFSKHFNDAPVIEVSGRSYPVDVRYQPVAAGDDDLAFEHAVLSAIRELTHIDRGDILIFLEGEREINELAKFLRKQTLPDTEILPLYARLGSAGQGRIFAAHQQRHIVLATNIAETSLTIPGIRYVIDPGYARISRYSPRSKIQRLPIEKISQAAANQRKGRCGRQSDGICIRLYSADDFDQRPLFTEPEIRRTNLASVALQMLALRLGDMREFPFLEPPDPRQINDAERLLADLAATRKDKKQLLQLTETGRQLAQMPIDPAFGRMLLAAADYQCLQEALIIVSALSIQDIRERPLDAQQQADAAHARFRDERSDFLEYLQLWQFCDIQSEKLSRNQFRHLCRENFLSYVRWREWRDIHRQLAQQMRMFGYKKNNEPADYETLHTALATGLLGGIAQKTEPGKYTGAHGTSLKIFPGSSQFVKQPKWIMAAERVETSQLFARTAAAIEPEWLLKPAAHLVKSDYFDPVWNPDQQRINAFEKISLHGLVLVPRRRIDYARIDPADARRRFIQHALVEGELRKQAPFFQHNQQVVADIRRLEHKSRRPDIFDEQALFEFYDERLPDSINDGPGLTAWRKQAEREQPELLFISAGQISRQPLDDITEYPDQVAVNGLQLPVDYAFQPGHEADGVTISVPVSLLNQLSASNSNAVFEQLVPGLLEEKVVSLLRALPKNLRRQFVPIPDTARKCLPMLRRQTGSSLSQALGACLLQMTGVNIPMSAWQDAEVPAHLQPRLRLVDANGNELDCSRDFAELSARWQSVATSQFSNQLDQAADETVAAFNRDGLTDWDFTELPEQIMAGQGDLHWTAYPSLVDKINSVALACFDTAGRALAETQQGLRRLYMLVLDKDLRYLERNLPHTQEICLAYSTLGRRQDLINDFLQRVTQQACMPGNEIVRSRAAFQQRLDTARPQLVSIANDLAELLYDILRRNRKLRVQLDGNITPQLLAAVTDIREQLDALIYPGFVATTDIKKLQHFPRYMDAIERRLQRLEQNPVKDKQLANEVAYWWHDYQQLAEAYGPDQNRPAAIDDYRWLIEEFRVSVFAQELKTAQPVSAKRLKALREQLRQTGQ